MSRWLRRSASALNVLPAFDEAEAVQDAMRGTALIMNDEYDHAEAALIKHNTPFHKLGLGCVCFLRAILSLQKEDLERGLKILGESEQASADFLKRAQSNPASSHQSAIYPPGTEYALAHAESQLMYAVCAVMNASYMESVKGLLKMRKAYATLQGIVEAEKKYLASIGHTPASLKAASSVRAASIRSAVPPSVVSKSAMNGTTNEDDDDDDDDFQDAEEDLSEHAIPQAYQGHLNTDMNALNLNGDKTFQNGHIQSGSVADTEDDFEDFDFRTVTSDPVDLFIHAGVGLAFGTMQLILSLIPPPFDKILSLFSFKGDRKVGLGLLWGATRFIDDINGALASLITLVFHNGPIAFSQIIPKSALPVERLHNLLLHLRKLYPRSQIWRIEEGIMLSEARQLQPALALFRKGDLSPLKSIQALGKFELGLHCLYAHEYAEGAQAFIDLLDISDWSHGLYYFVAAISYVELYREALSNGSADAQKHKKQAEAYFEEVYPNLGKKKVLGRELPIEIFVKRKMNKFNARASAQEISIVDAVGVSAVEQINFFWSGQFCMPDHDLRVSIQKLGWSENQSSWATETPDEKALVSLIKGSCLMVMGQYEKAKAELMEVTSLSPKVVQAASGKDADIWPLATAHYELAVLYWREAGGEGGDKATLQLAADELHKISHFGSYELESIYGLKVATGIETLRNLGCKI